MSVDIDNFDIEYYNEKFVKVFEGFKFEDPHKVYVHDMRILLRLIKALIHERKTSQKMIKGAHEANDKMQNRKYRMISLLTTLDSCLPEPADPKSLPEDYKFEVTLPWGLIKTIRHIIKGS